MCSCEHHKWMLGDGMQSTQGMQSTPTFLMEWNELPCARSWHNWQEGRAGRTAGCSSQHALPAAFPALLPTRILLLGREQHTCLPKHRMPCHTITVFYMYNPIPSSFLILFSPPSPPMLSLSGGSCGGMATRWSGCQQESGAAITARTAGSTTL